MSARDLDTKGLLLSSRLEQLSCDPFCFFCVDDYLPAEFYQDLLDSYPDASHHSPNEEGKMGFRSSVEPEAVDRFAEQHPVWKRLFDFFSSDAFLSDTRETLARPLVEARGWSGRKTWYNCSRREAPKNWLSYQLWEPVRSTFQFSLLPRDGVVIPHTDAPRKLVTFMLYFRDRHWQEGWGGATEFYAPLDRKRAKRWGRTQRIPFDQFKSIGTTEFVGNRLAGFVRSDESYHGVQPMTCPPGAARKVLVINIKRLSWSKRHRP